MTAHADIAGTQAGLYGADERAEHLAQALDELRRQIPPEREFLRRKLDDARSRVIAAGQDILFVAVTDHTSTEEVKRLADSLSPMILGGSVALVPVQDALRALAAERDELARSLGLARTDAYQRGYADGKRLAAGSGENQP